MAHGQVSTPTGSSVGGATSVTSAPRVASSRTLLRATRLCRTSPTIVTLRPSRSPVPPARWRRIVNASSSAWVGCSWVPSPALTTEPWIQPEWARRCGAPLARCRMTTASAPIASSVSAVSLRLSPLDTLEPLAEKLMTSAERRLAAASKEMRVRVESSKKRLTTVRPRRVGQLLHRAVGELRELGRGVEHEQCVVAVEIRRGQQVALHWSSPFACPLMRTASSPSCSATRTCTFSDFDVGMFLPT